MKSTSNFFLLLRRTISAVQGRLIAFTVLFGHLLITKYFQRSNQKPIWLIGENRGECLQENGYWFYQYCKNDTDQTVFFVVKSISPYYKNQLKSDPFTIRYGSLKHAVIFAKSTVCLYTHTYKDVMFKKSFERFGTKKKLVYLHHGVLGFKKFNSFYQKSKNLMDIFTVGSLLEKEILMKQAGVDETRIQAIGYARYDHFYNQSSDTQRQIVYIPTHRNYIKNNFGQSLFFKRVVNLLANEQLLGMLKQNNITLKIYLHKEMQPYSHMLSSDKSCIRIVRLGEESPQKLISESNLMITDYSSVSWDFFYLGKPIVFYRFDIEYYLEDRDSYINLYHDIIGDVIFEESQLIKTISNYVNNDFKMEERHSLYRQKIVPNLDHNNCERIYNEIISL
jgi:CDP-glycerol glycerophosphotransferase (TagB/SpsB family)